MRSAWSILTFGPHWHYNPSREGHGFHAILRPGLATGRFAYWPPRTIQHGQN